MPRVTYIRQAAAQEAAAPAGYYAPWGEGLLDFQGKKVLYVLGDACIEASCCGVGSWTYIRVQGYLVGPGPEDETKTMAQIEWGKNVVEVDTIEDPAERVALVELLAERHPGARVEFR